jgi:hypothetical protein
LELGNDRPCPRSYIDADLAVSHVEPLGLINRRYFSSDKVEWKIRELRKNVVSA